MLHLRRCKGGTAARHPPYGGVTAERAPLGGCGMMPVNICVCAHRPTRGPMIDPRRGRRTHRPTGRTCHHRAGSLGRIRASGPHSLETIGNDATLAKSTTLRCDRAQDDDAQVDGQLKRRMSDVSAGGGLLKGQRSKGAWRVARLLVATACSGERRNIARPCRVQDRPEEERHGQQHHRPRQHLRRRCPPCARTMLSWEVRARAPLSCCHPRAAFCAGH